MYPLKKCRWLQATWVDRGANKTDVTDSVDDALYACNMRINLQTKSRMRQLAEADWVVRVVEPKHASISHAMDKRKHQLMIIFGN